MKGIAIILAGMLSFSANAFDWNEAFGTYEGISDNYVAEETFAEYGSDELAEAETNGYFTQWEEAVAIWNEENGYWN